MSLKSVLRRVVVTGGLALTALLMSHPGHAMMAKAGPSDWYNQATIYNTGATGSCSHSIQVNLNGSATYRACQYEHGTGLLPLFLAHRFFVDLQYKVNGHGHLAKLSLALSDDAMQPLAYTHVQQGHCASPASKQHQTLIIEGGTACGDSPIFVERPSFGVGPIVVPVPEYGEDGPIIIQVPTYGNPYLYGRNPYFYGVGPWTYGSGHWIFGGNYGSFPWNRFGRSGWGFGPGFWGFGHGGWGFGHGGISVGGGFGSHHTV